MTIKVGDMVRVTNDHVDLTDGKCYKGTDLGYRVVVVKDDVGDDHVLNYWDFTTTPTILTTITDRMEQHMAAGQYVQAVKWAQVAEMVKELEDE